MDTSRIFAIERPHPRLFTHYMIQCFLVPPVSLLALPVLFFRYHTMKYRFDAEGISMSWGILFRRQVNLTYARIQDIHLTSGFIQRWLGLADIHIQTASGSATAEMKIEGLLEYEMVRDFLYTRMRGYRDKTASAPPPLPAESTSAAAHDMALTLAAIRDEMRGAREALEALAARSGREGAGE